MLVGNKCDMEDQRVVTFERGQQLAEELGFPFFETSAKDDKNVKVTFDKLVDIICDKMSECVDKDPTLIRNINNNQNAQNKPASSCCWSNNVGKNVCVCLGVHLRARMLARVHCILC